MKNISLAKTCKGFPKSVNEALCEPTYKDYVTPFVLALAVLMLTLLVCVFEAKAQEVIPEDIAVSCILGEARGEGYQGMLAVAEAMRNRGHIKGVDGCDYQAKNGDPIQKAFRAWYESEFTNLTNGADHWHADYINPWWARYGKMTAKVGAHIFYKEVYR